MLSARLNITENISYIQSEKNLEHLSGEEGEREKKDKNTIFSYHCGWQHIRRSTHRPYEYIIVASI